MKASLQILSLALALGLGTNQNDSFIEKDMTHKELDEKIDEWNSKHVNLYKIKEYERKALHIQLEPLP